MKTNKDYKSVRPAGACWLASAAILTLSVGCNAEHAESMAKHRSEIKKHIEKTTAEIETHFNVAKKMQAMKEGDLDSLPSIIPASGNKESVSESQKTSDQEVTANDKAKPETAVESPEKKAEQGEIVNDDVPDDSVPNSEVANVENSEVASDASSASEPKAESVDSSKPNEEKTVGETPEANELGKESKEAVAAKAAEQPASVEHAPALPISPDVETRVPRIERVLPKDGPSWLTAKPDYRNEVHTWVVNTSTSDSEEAGKNNLLDRAYAEFVEYANKQLGADVTAIKSINPKWVSTRLVKQDGDIYFSQLDGNPVGWARLSVDPATRDEVVLMNQQAQWYPRSMRVASLMLSAIAVFGLAHVGLNAATAVFKKK